MARGEAPHIWQLGSIRKDGSRNRIHPADVRGRYVRWRGWTYAVLMAIYVALPLVKVGEHPAIHLDVAARRFYLFGSTFNAQDFWLVLLLLTVVGFGLLFFTSWLGRVWCGWACPQTVFLEGVYRRIERLVDGPRERRLKREGAPRTAAGLARSALKHGLYLLVSWVLAHVALALFVSMKDLTAMVTEGPAQHLTVFVWAVAVTGLLYGNFAWFREQLCIVVCPYGRLQSAMVDRDSIIIGYDARRGEPRGRVVKAQAKAVEKPAEKALGDCVDCRRCVVVCPTGIDIRNGLQMECIGCAQCIDACDEVMDKVGRPRGLIRYDSLKGLEGEPRRVLRPRLLTYAALVLVAAAGLVVSLLSRTPFEANLLRMQGAPYILDGDTVRNHLSLHLVNKGPEPATFTVQVESAAPIQVTLPQREVRLGSLESFELPILVALERAQLGGPAALVVRVRDAASGEERRVETRFVGPPRVGG